MPFHLKMNLANKISIGRILLIPFFVAAILYYRPESDYLRFVALTIFTLGVISDAVDGYLARNRGQRSKLGVYLDPIADKLLLITAFICLSMVNSFPAELRLPPWVPLIVISRDIIIVLGSVIIHLITQKLEIIPSKLGKATTVFQMMTIICVLLQLPYSFIVWDVAVLFTILSGMGYIRRGSRLLTEAG